MKNGKRLIICCIYRAPTTDLALLNEHINLICSTNNSKNIYICGDFNVDLLQYDKPVETNNLIDKLYIAFIKDFEKCNWDEILAEEDVNMTSTKFVNLFTNVFNTNCPVN